MSLQYSQKRVFRRAIQAVAWAAAWVFLAATLKASDQVHVIDVVADRSSHFKVPGQSKPQIVLKAGEAVLLRIDAQKGKTWNRDGVIHGFTVLRTKDHTKVAGWDLELRPGVQEFTLTAPTEAGDYDVLCTVICSGDHEGMRMKLIVVP